MATSTLTGLSGSLKCSDIFNFVPRNQITEKILQTLLILLQTLFILLQTYNNYEISTYNLN